MRLCTAWLCISRTAVRTYSPVFSPCIFSKRVSYSPHTRHVSSTPPWRPAKPETVETAIHHLHTLLLTESAPAPCLTFTRLLERVETNAHAEEIFYLAQESGYGDQVSIYNAKMSYHLKNKNFEYLFETRDLMKQHKVTPDHFSYCLTITAHCTLGDIERGLECLNEIEKRASSDNTIKIDAAIYIPFMRYYNSKNNSREVVAIYEDMKRKQVSPTSDVYVLLLHAAKRGGIVSLDSVITQMTTVDGLPLDEMIISAYVDLTLRMNELLAAERMVERGTRESQLLPRLKPLTFLASTYAKRSMFDKMMWLFEMIVKLNYIPDSTFFQFMIACFSPKQFTNQIGQFVAYMEEKKIPISQESYTQMIKHYSETNNTKAMIRHYEAMKPNHSITTPVYSTMMKCYARSDMMTQAEAIMREADADNRSLSFPAYLALAEAYYRRHNHAKANQVLQHMARVCKSKKAEVDKLLETHKIRYE